MLYGPGTMDNVQSQAKSYGSQLSEIARGFADGINHGIVSSLFLWYDSPVEGMTLVLFFHSGMDGTLPGSCGDVIPFATVQHCLHHLNPEGLLHD